MPQFSFGKIAILPLLLGGLTLSPAFAEEAEDAADWGSFGIQTQWIDEAATPGDDFDRYVNGVWNDTIEMPADRTRYGAFIELRDLSQDRLLGILEELAAGDHAAGSDEKRIADAWRAFMDTEAIEAAGFEPARPYLERIYSASSSADLAAIFGLPGYASPIGANVDADEKQSDRYILYINQSGIGLPDRDYYLEDTERYREIRQKYRAHLAFLLGRLGYKNPQPAADAVFALEQRLARAMWDRSISRNRDLTYNKLEPGELSQLGPDGVLASFLTALGVGTDHAVIASEMPPTEAELAAAKLSPEMVAAKLGGGLPATLKLIEEVPLATWQAWLAVRFIDDHAEFLPSDIDDAHFAFFGTELGGQPEQRARWKRAISAVEDQLGELLGRIYAERYYPPEEQAAMEDLVVNLRQAMAANLEDLSWMGSETRAEAKLKLDAFTPKIGAPDSYKAYEGLEIGARTALANQLAASGWALNDIMARIGKPVDRGEWFMYPHTVNAYYNPTFNEIVFPAAILQPPFFNVSADPAVNYGAIGAVIGHELGHGFDDQGAKSDGTGNLRNWWTDQDRENFEALQDRLVAQYNSFCPFDEGKTCINGRLTLGENIGDLGGLSLAYRAYRLSLDGKEPPVIGGFTGDQRFFLAWAQVWRGQVREAQARQYLVTDPHSPPKYRINAVVRNFREWYEAFDVEPGDALYIPPEERVRIW